MPLYDWECECCHKTEEHLMKLDDPEPLCGGCYGKMKRVLSATADYQGRATRAVNANLDKWGAGEYKE